jgi:predicted O-methyltransferase YrrM
MRKVQSGMRPLLCSALLSISLTLPAAATQIVGPSSALPPAIERVLRGIKAADAELLAVSEEDGRFLRVLVSARSAKSVLEIGAASGYSGIWLGLGARESGGRVVAIEYDAKRAKEAAANIRTAGLGDVVRVVQGDAFSEIPRLTGSFDLVFLDAWKPDYKKFFDLVFPRLAPGALFVAHNVVNKKTEMEPFLRTILTHPALFTTIVSPSHEGMSVSYKIR